MIMQQHAARHNLQVQQALQQGPVSAQNLQHAMPPSPLIAVAGTATGAATLSGSTAAATGPGIASYRQSSPTYAATFVQATAAPAPPQGLADSTTRDLAHPVPPPGVFGPSAQQAIQQSRVVDHPRYDPAWHQQCPEVLPGKPSSRFKSMLQRGSGGAVLQVLKVVEEDHTGVQFLCFGTGASLITLSVLSLVFGLSEPHEFLLAAWNCVFGLVILVIDGKPEWWAKLFDMQRRIYSQAAFLASHTGRAAFYLYVGLNNMFLLPGITTTWRDPSGFSIWATTYALMGLALIMCALIMLYQQCKGKQVAFGSGTPPSRTIGGEHAMGHTSPSAPPVAVLPSQAP